uniref:Uncharacterized protein n=1 Tax=Rattus norvegicus TaxID=10116 RepID=B6VQA7_RAT|nr:hypothetical protein [Rattus norvegicus]
MRFLLSYIPANRQPLLDSSFKPSISASVRTGLQWRAVLSRVDFYLHHPKMSYISSTTYGAHLFLILAINF